MATRGRVGPVETGWRGRLMSETPRVVAVLRILAAMTFSNLLDSSLLWLGRPPTGRSHGDRRWPLRSIRGPVNCSFA